MQPGAGETTMSKWEAEKAERREEIGEDLQEKMAERKRFRKKIEP